MARHYTDDLRAGGLTQMAPNDEEGGILIFDSNEVVADCVEDGESHQLHLRRPLTDEEHDQLSEFVDVDVDCFNEEDFHGQLVDQIGIYWLNAGVVSAEARAYLLSLKA